MTELAECYIRGIAVGVNEPLAVAFSKMASDAEDPKGMCWHGSMKMYGRKTERNILTASQLAEKAVEKGYQDPKMILAVRYFHGLSIERDPLKAVELWTEVIESGRIDCVLELGPIYEHWLSVDVDLHKAAELYKMASGHSSDLWKRQFFQAYHGICLIRGR